MKKNVRPKRIRIKSERSKGSFIQIEIWIKICCEQISNELNNLFQQSGTPYNNIKHNRNFIKVKWP